MNLSKRLVRVAVLGEHWRGVHTAGIHPTIGPGVVNCGPLRAQPRHGLEGRVLLSYSAERADEAGAGAA